MAYCYATEISYKILTDEDISDFMNEAVVSIKNNRMPDTRKTIFLIIASVQAYYESLPPGTDGKKPAAPITERELMYECTPQELGILTGTILGMWAQFYHLPAGETEDKPSDEDPKNA